MLLQALDIDYAIAGSTTFKRQDLIKGIEPDDSFYIQNYERVLNKDRIDLSMDPPPDLAIEVDLTAKTQLDLYEALGVPERWRYDGGRLRIDILENGQYVQSTESLCFPGWPVVEMAEKYVTQAREVGQGKAIKVLRQRVQNRLSNLQ